MNYTETDSTDRNVMYIIILGKPSILELKCNLQHYSRNENKKAIKPIRRTTDMNINPSQKHSNQNTKVPLDQTAFE